jgi:hypothetical protein
VSQPQRLWRQGTTSRDRQYAHNLRSLFQYADETKRREASSGTLFDIGIRTGVRILHVSDWAQLEIVITTYLKWVHTYRRTPLLQVNMPSKQQDCNSTLDREFGPVVACHDFDFTLSFEQSVFEIGVSSLFLVLLPFCLWVRLRTPRKWIKAPFFSVKVVGTSCKCAEWLLIRNFH